MSVRYNQFGSAAPTKVHQHLKGKTPVNDALRTKVARFERNLRTFGRRTTAYVRKFYQEKILGQTAERQAAGNIDELDDETAEPGLVETPARPVKTRVKPIRRRSRQKVYRLKGYTTVAKINHKRQSERQQRLLRQLLVFLICVLLLFLAFQLYNPIKDLSEWYRIIGIRDISDLTRESTSGPTRAGDPTGTGPTTTPALTTQTTTGTSSTAD